MMYIYMYKMYNTNVKHLSTSNITFINYITYYSKIDNSVSSPQLGYHCLFVNIPLYAIVFGYDLFIDLFIIIFLIVH